MVKVNVETTGTVSEAFDAAPNLGHFIIPPAIITDFETAGVDTARPAECGANWVDVSCGGQIGVHSVSIVTQNAGDDLDDVSVVGWSG